MSTTEAPPETTATSSTGNSSNSLASSSLGKSLSFPMNYYYNLYTMQYYLKAKRELNEYLASTSAARLREFNAKLWESQSGFLPGGLSPPHSTFLRFSTLGPSASLISTSSLPPCLPSSLSPGQSSTPSSPKQSLMANDTSSSQVGTASGSSSDTHPHQQFVEAYQRYLKSLQNNNPTSNDGSSKGSTSSSPLMTTALAAATIPVHRRRGRKRRIDSVDSSSSGSVTDASGMPLPNLRLEYITDEEGRATEVTFYECPFPGCPSRYRSRRRHNCDRHISTMHLKEALRECCNQLFRSKADFEAHQAQVHKRSHQDKADGSTSPEATSQDYHCAHEECQGLLFRTLTLLRRHQMAVHHHQQQISRK